jgi:hypothetical protein
MQTNYVLKHTYLEGLLVVRKCDTVYMLLPFDRVLHRFGHVYIIFHLESSLIFTCR